MLALEDSVLVDDIEVRREINCMKHTLPVQSGPWMRFFVFDFALDILFHTSMVRIRSGDFQRWSRPETCKQAHSRAEVVVACL